MTGHLDIVPAGTPLRAAVRVAFELADGRTLVLDDARALGKVHVHTAEEILSVLAAVGIEPLSRDFTAEWLIEAARKSRRPVKLFLMDQASVAGLGNIYAAEALFRAGIHPSRIASEISSLRLRRLHRAIVDVLWDAVQSAGAVYRSSGGFSATETFQPAVYGREGESCGRCGARVRRLVQAGRSTYYCPRCQR
jgi:formamidopyrimidine-DNA glycosylase